MHITIVTFTARILTHSHSTETHIVHFIYTVAQSNDVCDHVPGLAGTAWAKLCTAVVAGLHLRQPIHFYRDTKQHSVHYVVQDF